jgi:phage host-nuclease inhibitor protein Gam
MKPSRIIQKIPEQHIEKVQNQGTTKTAILVTAHIRWKVLM